MQIMRSELNCAISQRCIIPVALILQEGRFIPGMRFSKDPKTSQAQRLFGALLV